MCGRYQLLLIWERLAALAGAPEQAPLPLPLPAYNITPTSRVLVRVERPEGPPLAVARWGFPSSWLAQPWSRPILNTRAEEAVEKEFWREPMANGRCLLPCTGFYEWTGNPRSPIWFRPVQAEVLWMAGVGAAVVGPEGRRIGVVSILTVPANSVVGAVHDRMPAFLDAHTASRWLDRKVLPNEARELLQPAPAELLRPQAVHPRLGEAGADGPELLQPPPQGRLF
jgi:putative SOS response-associated peptidase YedK